MRNCNFNGIWMILIYDFCVDLINFFLLLAWRIERSRRPEKGYLYYADAFKYGWKEDHGKVLLDLLLKLCRDGGVKEGNITDEAWLWIRNSFNNSTKCNFEINFLQERLRDYRQLYLLLAENSSPNFHWDRENKTIRLGSCWREVSCQHLVI
jgi:Myb/SANT-like DNA-binding domain